MSSLVQYQAALKSRNAMLKDPARFNRGSRMAYERQLARHGAVVTINRQRFVQAYEPLVRKVAQGLFPTGSSIGVQYKSQLLRRYDYDDEKMLEETMYEQLQAEADADTEWPTTRVGPHRDDLVLVLNEKPAAVFGSEGQCRLLSLALRLGFVNLLKRHQQDRDLVLLVDDVFGELDAERRHHFFRQLDVGAQIFVACTEVPPELKDKDVSIFDVARGSLRLRGE